MGKKICLKESVTQEPQESLMLNLNNPSCLKLVCLEQKFFLLSAKIFPQGKCQKKIFPPTTLLQLGLILKLQKYQNKTQTQWFYSSLPYSYLPACSFPCPEIRNKLLFPPFLGFHLYRCSCLTCQAKFHLSEVSQRLSMLNSNFLTI